MPGPVCRVGDKNSVGGVIITGNPTVLVNGRPIAVIGSTVSPHPICGAKGGASHCAAKTTSKNFRVLVGGKPVVTVGDLDTCGHPRASGAYTVIVGK